MILQKALLDCISIAEFQPSLGSDVFVEFVNQYLDTLALDDECLNACTQEGRRSFLKILVSTIELDEQGIKVSRYQTTSELHLRIAGSNARLTTP